MGDKLRVLIVEDSERDTKLLLRELERGGNVVEWKRVETGDEMRSALEAAEWDIILSDHKMPRFSSREALAILQGSGIDIPFIIVSGSIGEEMAIAAMRAGAHDYIIKGQYARLLPATERELGEAVVRREKQMALEKSSQFGRIIENSSNEIYVFSSETLNFMQVNRGARENLGYTMEELKKMTPVDIKLEHTEKSFMELTAPLRKDESELITFTTIHKRKDDSHYPVEVRLQLYLKEKPPVFVAIIQDITKRIKAQQELQRKTDLIKLLNEISMAANEATTFEEAMNVSLDKICSYTEWPVGHVYILDSAGTLSPTKIWSLKYPEKFQTFKEITQDTIFKKGIGLPGRVLRDGKPHWIVDVTKDENFPRAKAAKNIGVKGAFAFPVLEQERVVAVLEFFSENAEELDPPLMDAIGNLAIQLGRVTERKKAEEKILKGLQDLEKTQVMLIRSEKLASMGALSAGVAHEIKNPLNIISTITQLLAMEDGLTEERDKEYKKILQQVDRAVKITENLRDFAKDREPEKCDIDLNRLLNKTLRLVEFEMKVENIKIIRDFTDQSALFLGDPDQLSQVFLNIMNNARESMNEKQQSLRKSTGASVEWEGLLTVKTEITDNSTLITFQDTGQGISPDVINKVFDPFFSTKEKGTGLGMSISYGIIENHNGTMEINSKQGEGATFTITLPRD